MSSMRLNSSNCSLRVCGMSEWFLKVFVDAVACRGNGKWLANLQIFLRRQSVVIPFFADGLPALTDRLTGNPVRLTGTPGRLAGYTATGLRLLASRQSWVHPLCGFLLHDRAAGQKQCRRTCREGRAGAAGNVGSEGYGRLISSWPFPVRNHISCLRLSAGRPQAWRIRLCRQRCTWAGCSHRG